jgi:hypothetical protein
MADFSISSSHDPDNNSIITDLFTTEDTNIMSCYNACFVFQINRDLLRAVLHYLC